MGAFEVDAEIVAGRVRYLTVHSLKGNLCRVYGPWADEPVEVTCRGQPVSFDELDGVIRFDTIPGETYTLRKAGRESDPAAFRIADLPTGPLRYVGPAYLGQIPEEKQVPIWFGLPPLGT